MLIDCVIVVVFVWYLIFHVDDDVCNILALGISMIGGGELKLSRFYLLIKPNRLLPNTSVT